MRLVSEPPVFTPSDDGLHSTLAGDEWWFTETSWFSFHHPERELGGWFYTMIRPNIGTVAGGAWVWDASASVPWEVPYSANYSALQLPANCDLRNADLPTGVSIEVIEPTLGYRLGYASHPKERSSLHATLEFRAVDPPRPLTTTASTFGRAAHFDQIGHVTGEIVVNDERLTIDCWGMRDRTWGRRPEDRPRRAAYVTAAGDGGAGFLAVTSIEGEDDRIAYGFLKRPGGQQVDWASGERHTARHPSKGWIEQITISGTDADGNNFEAHGQALSRIIINRHTFIDVNSLVRWEIPSLGLTWWGEDQDMWPMGWWAATNRTGAF